MKPELSADVNFAKAIDFWVMRLVTEMPTTSFASLVSHLPGIYPLDVFESIQRLLSFHSDKITVFAALINEAKQAHYSTDEEYPASILPVPHPLDYDWRFTDDSAARLLNECTKATEPTDRIAFLGAPSLAVLAAQIGFPRRFVLLDRNALAIKALQSLVPPNGLIHCDLASDDFLPGVIGVRAIVVDPPWYFAQMKSFLWSAAKLCESGGKVFVSLPPFGTRPGIAEERASLLACADKLGLSLKSVDEGILDYASPLFEQNALRAAGLLNIPHNWRRADLATFSRTNSELVGRPPSERSDQIWSDHVISGVSIRVRTTEHLPTGFFDPSLQSIFPGDILPTVSRRDFRRSFPDVWTTGNRVFRCQQPAILRAILEAIRSGRSPISDIQVGIRRGLSGSEIAEVLLTVRQINKLITIELNDQTLGRNRPQLAAPNL